MIGTYYTTKVVFDLKERDIYWCTATGSITGHSYIVSGPLAIGPPFLSSEILPITRTPAAGGS